MLLQNKTFLFCFFKRSSRSRLKKGGSNCDQPKRRLRRRLKNDCAVSAAAVNILHFLGLKTGFVKEKYDPQ